MLRQNLAVRPDLECFCVDVKACSRNIPVNASFATYNGKSIPFKDKTFDIISVNHVLEHIRDPNIVLLELKRVLKIKGRIFLEVPNERALWGKPKGRFAGTVHFTDDPTHIRPYSKTDLVELGKSCGFKIAKVGITRNLVHLFVSPVLLALGFLMPEKLWFMYGRNSLLGWSSYIILENNDDKNISI